MRFLLLIYVLFSSIPLFSQGEDITWSGEEKLNGEVIQTLIKDRNNYYVITVAKNPGYETMIYHFSYGKLIRQGLIPNSLNSSIHTLEDIRILNNQIYLFFSSQQPDGNKLYAQRVSDNCQLLGEPQLLVNQQLKTTFNSKSLDYLVTTSPDNQYLSISYLYDNENVLKFPKLNTVIYNGNLIKLKEETLEMEYYLSELSLEEVQLTNEGSLLLLVQGYRRPSNLKVKFNSLDLYFIPTNKKSHHLQLATNGRSFFNPILRHENDSLYLIAYQYNQLLDKKKEQTGSKGVGFYEYNPVKDSLSEIKELEFDKNYLLQSLDEKAKKKYEKAQRRGKSYNLALFNYRLRNITPLSDKSYLLLMEENWSIRRSIEDGRMYTSYYLYNFNNVMVMKFDPQLVRDYSVILPKVQVTRDDGGYFSSFSRQITKDNHLQLLFNDNITNYDESGRYIRADHPENMTVNAKKNGLVFIDVDLQTGKYQRKIVFRDEVQGLLIPQLYEKNDLFNTFLLTFQNKNSYQFAQFVF